MKKLLSILLINASALLISANALAAYEPGFYITVGGGVAIPDSDFSTHGDSNTILFAPTEIGTSLFQLADVTWKNDFETGFDLNAAMGYQFCQNWRVDAEFFYQNIDRSVEGSYTWDEIYPTTRDLRASHFNEFSSRSTKTNIYSLMANVYYDYVNFTRWTPSLGIGIGISWINSGGNSRDEDLVAYDVGLGGLTHTPAISRSPSLSGQAFTWQIKPALAYLVCDNLELVAAYRLWGQRTFTQAAVR